MRRTFSQELVDFSYIRKKKTLRPNYIVMSSRVTSITTTFLVLLTVLAEAVDVFGFGERFCMRWTFFYAFEEELSECGTHRSG